MGLGRAPIALSFLLLMPTLFSVLVRFRFISGVSIDRGSFMAMEETRNGDTQRKGDGHAHLARHSVLKRRSQVPERDRPCLDVLFTRAMRGRLRTHAAPQPETGHQPIGHV